MIVCLQFWRGDIEKAMRLARFIADLEPLKRSDVEFLFVARFDCDHDHETIHYVQEKFEKVHWIATHTKWTGWPGGCNGMARDTLEWLSVNRTKTPALLLEPDCVPVTKDWLDRLSKEATRLFIAADKWLAGDWRNSGGPYGHVNGNCLIRPDIIPQLLEHFNEGLAWDCAIAPAVRTNWYFTPLIKNRFESKNATYRDLHGANWYPGRLTAVELEEYRPVLVHGFKDDSAFELAKEELLP
jgi:hypothetical protein